MKTNELKKSKENYELRSFYFKILSEKLWDEASDELNISWIKYIFGRDAMRKTRELQIKKFNIIFDEMLKSNNLDLIRGRGE